MQALLSIYAWTIAASTILGSALALLGVQLAARDRAMQTMCIGQGAMLGVLVGIGFFLGFEATPTLSGTGPVALAFTASALTYIVSERIASRHGASTNTHFTSLFSALLAGGYLISALFPALENHMAQRYFGDLATISRSESIAALLMGLLILTALCWFHRSITRDSFAVAILGSKASATPTGFVFSLGTLLSICFCVQIVGFLFTVACLFLPTSILSFRRNAGLKGHLVTCVLTAGLASLSGFTASLWFTHLPTVPTIVVLMVVFAILIKNLAGQQFYKST